MVYLLATIANDADYMAAHLYALRGEVAPGTASTTETWGLGYYVDDRALIIKKPVDILSDRSAFALAAELKSRIVVANGRTGPRQELAPPFRFRRWLFGCTGTLDALTHLRAKVSARLPDFVRTELGHRSEAELAFGMFLAELIRAQALDDPLIPAKAIAESLARTADTIRRLSLEAEVQAPEAAFVATNGRSVVATCSGRPLFYRTVAGLEGLPEGPLDPELADFKTIAAGLKRFRAVVVAAGVPEGRPGWNRLGPTASIWIDPKLETDTFEL